MTPTEKTINFIEAIKNVYRDEEKQAPIKQMKLDNDNLTEDFTAMVYALNIFFNQITEQENDIIDFIHILNKLVVQHILEQGERGQENE